MEWRRDNEIVLSVAGCLKALGLAGLEVRNPEGH
jgi:hypothetical protein